jgi:hypothetical protein
MDNIRVQSSMVAPAKVLSFLWVSNKILRRMLTLTALPGYGSMKLSRRISALLTSVMVKCKRTLTVMWVSLGSAPAPVMNYLSRAFIKSPTMPVMWEPTPLGSAPVLRTHINHLSRAFIKSPTTPVMWEPTRLGPASAPCMNYLSRAFIKSPTTPVMWEPTPLGSAPVLRTHTPLGVSAPVMRKPTLLGSAPVTRDLLEVATPAPVMKKPPTTIESFVVVNL